MRKADIALYRGENGGRGQYRQFEKVMDESRTRQQIAADLRQALVTYDGGSVSAADGDQRPAIVGLEALLRWHHPQRRCLACGLYRHRRRDRHDYSLGEWVLREACKTALKLPQVIVAVNVSPVQFRASGFVERMIEIVQSEGADPAAAGAEITEGVLIEDEARNSIIALRDAGFRIALDDFGTGYSSLNYLSTFPVDKIKIDRSFTQSLGVAENSPRLSNPWCASATPWARPSPPKASKPRARKRAGRCRV